MEPKEHVYYPGLDSLRGVAIIMVLLYHYFPFFRIGWLGVDLFFVLSGFLITTHLLKSRRTSSYFRNFYIRRVLRIFPLYYGFLLVFFLLGSFVFSQIGGTSNFGYYASNQWWYWLFLQNWLMIDKGVPPEPYLIHFWSLAIEEQFYLLWPLLVFLLKELSRLKQVIVLVFCTALIVRIICWNYFHLPVYANYYNSFARMDSLAAGAFLATLIHQNNRIPPKLIALSTFFFVLLLSYSALFYRNVSHVNGAFATIGYSVSAIFFTCLCFLALKEKRWPIQFFFLRYIGRISYGLYVFHLPILLAGSALLTPLLNYHFTLLPTQLTIGLICLILTFVASLLSYNLIELPLLRLKNKFR